MLNAESECQAIQTRIETLLDPALDQKTKELRALKDQNAQKEAQIQTFQTELDKT